MNRFERRSSQLFQSLMAGASFLVLAVLVSKSDDRLMVERSFTFTDESASNPIQIHSFIAEKWIDPSYHPTTDPRTRIGNLAGKRLTVEGKPHDIAGRTIVAAGSYPEWGADLEATICRNDAIPGHLGEIALQSHFLGEPFEYEGHCVEIKVVP